MTLGGRSLFLVTAPACLIVAGCSGDSASNEQSDATEAANLALKAADVGSGKAWRSPKITGCAIDAYSFEDDPKGLVVRAGPSLESNVLGRLYSLVDAPPDEEPLPSDPMIGPHFTIIAVQGEWLKIADITAVSEGWDRSTHKLRKLANFQGIGWISQARVAVETGYWDEAYVQPYFESGSWRAVDEDAGVNLYPWNGLPFGRETILACDRNWVKLSYDRIATKTSKDARIEGENVRFFDQAERSRYQQVTGWMKSEGNVGTTGICTPGDADCPLRRAHDWD